MGNYDDIINLPHYVSKKHPRLSVEQRVAQFAPFVALTVNYLLLLYNRNNIS